MFYDYMPEIPAADSSIYLNLTRSGIPLLFLHHAICSFQSWNGYKEMVGGKYRKDGFGVDSAGWTGSSCDQGNGSFHDT
jgi:hypothetical protein